MNVFDLIKIRGAIEAALECTEAAPDYLCETCRKGLQEALALFPKPIRVETCDCGSPACKVCSPQPQKCIGRKVCNLLPEHWEGGINCSFHKCSYYQCNCPVEPDLCSCGRPLREGPYGEECSGCGDWSCRCKKLPDEKIESIAEDVHKAYLETSERLGLKIKKQHRVPYAELSEEDKELDRGTVRAVLSHLKKEAK